MISYVKLGNNTGVYANKEKAIEYLENGYKVFSDITCKTGLTKEDLEVIDETLTYTGEIQPTTRVTIGSTTAPSAE